MGCVHAKLHSSSTSHSVAAHTSILLLNFLKRFFLFCRRPSCSKRCAAGEAALAAKTRKKTSAFLVPRMACRRRPPLTSTTTWWVRCSLSRDFRRVESAWARARARAIAWCMRPASHTWPVISRWIWWKYCDFVLAHLQIFLAPASGWLFCRLGFLGDSYMYILCCVMTEQTTRVTCKS